MIQFSVMGNKGIGSSNKSTSKMDEPSSAFDELLQQLNGIGNEAQETINLLGFLNQSLPITPFIQPSTNPDAQSGVQDNSDFIPNQQATISRSSLQSAKEEETLLAQLNGGEMVKQSQQPFVDAGKKTNEHTVEMSDQSSPILIEKEMGSNQKDTLETFDLLLNNQKIMKQPEDHILVDKVKDSYQKDAVEIPPLHGHFSIEGMMKENSPMNLINPSEKQAVPIPVRENHLEKDISMMLKSAIHMQSAKDGLEATFSLYPQHLGTVHVKVMTKDGAVTAEFLTSTPLGKDLLQSNVHALNAALEQQGFQVDKIDITQQNTSSFAGMFSQKGDSHARQGQSDSRKRNERLIQRLEEELQDYSAEIPLSSRINTTA